MTPSRYAVTSRVWYDGTGPMRLVLLLALSVPVAASGARAQPTDPVEEVTRLRDLLLHARYEEAVAAARALLARRDLSASQRNHALESRVARVLRGWAGAAGVLRG